MKKLRQTSSAIQQTEPEKVYIPLSDPETAAQYDSLIEIDQWVHVPALFGEDQCFKGMISTIGPKAARRYELSGGNLIKRKASS